MEPPRPPDDDPEPRYKAPLLPLLAVPELNTSRPLTPLVPAFEVRILNAPLLDLDPKPDAMLKPPPVTSLLSPAYTPTRPPDPLEPLPTANKIDPPRPPDEEPDPIYKPPLLPLLAVPELNTSNPLTPLVPAFDVRILNAPLLDLDPKPVAILKLPPVTSLLSPPYMLIPPPDPLDPLPTASKIDPPRPPEDDPDPMYRAPLLPRVAVPELNTSKPLTPLVPALLVRILTAPLLVDEPRPLTTFNPPPVKALVSPEYTPTRPPDPLMPLPTVKRIEPPRPPDEDPDPI